MAGNSLADILDKMKQGGITEKWGAVLAFGQERLNRLLFQQWLQKYDGKHYVPVFSGTVFFNDTKTEWGVLKDVLLGNPLLSFEPAALDNARAVLTLSLLSGSFTAFEQTSGMLYSYEITEAQGKTLKIKLDLDFVVGKVNRLGRVTLDLSKGVEFACDLAASTANQVKIGGLFRDRFNALPLERRVYELGWLDLQGGGDLSPYSFRLLTQRAPGAELPGAPNAHDGAVIVLMQLRGSPMGGDTPSKDRFPYLIPDDLENGVPKYSATLVLAKEYISRSDDEKLELIRSVLFPGEQTEFVEYSRHTHHDMGVFGSLEPSTSSLTVEPASYSMKAGSTPLTYKAYLNGVALSTVKWSVRSLNTIGSAGKIDELTGVYQPVSAALIGKGSVRNIVTATWVQPAEGDRPARTHRVSSLLLVTTEAMSLSPACVPRQVRGPTVTFVATAPSGSTLTWSKPAYGTLVASGNTATYTPPTADLPEHLLVQDIEVSDGSGETVRASVVLSNFPVTMKIDPPFVSALARTATVELKDVTDASPELERHWEVLGEGSVLDGVFTAPASSTKPFSVVKCDIFYGDLLLRTGYSVIQLKNFDEEPGWTTTTKFSLSALRSLKVYGNGYQQAAIEADIETDGRRMTVDEENTLRLYFLNNQEVAEVAPGQEGIPYDPAKPVLWAQTFNPNNFRPYQGTLNIASDNRPLAEQPNKIPLYVVTRDTSVTEFYASVTNPDGLPINSNVYPGHTEGTIKLTPEASPEINPSYYSFSRRRIIGEGTGDPANGESDDDFDNELNSVDYYDLNYLKEGQRALTFVALELFKDSRQSLASWESKFQNEKMFSYLGYAFNDPRKSGDNDVMHFDSIIKANPILMQNLDETVQGGVAQGRFLIGLFRRTDVRQDDWRGQPGNKDLHPLRGTGLKMILTDSEGHRHPIEIQFRDGNRNRLRIIPLAEL